MHLSEAFCAREKDDGYLTSSLTSSIKVETNNQMWLWGEKVTFPLIQIKFALSTPIIELVSSWFLLSEEDPSTPGFPRRACHWLPVHTCTLLFPTGQGGILLGSHECPVGYSMKTAVAEANFLRVWAFLHVRILILMASCQGQKMRADLPHDAYLCPYCSCSFYQCSQFLYNMLD